MELSAGISDRRVAKVLAANPAAGWDDLKSRLSFKLSPSPRLRTAEPVVFFYPWP